MFYEVNLVSKIILLDWKNLVFDFSQGSWNGFVSDKFYSGRIKDNILFIDNNAILNYFLAYT